MTPTTLARVGEALYGPLWQTQLARDLGVAGRTVRRWAAGSHDMPPGITADLTRLCDHRAAEIDAAADMLREMLDAAASAGGRAPLF